MIQLLYLITFLKTICVVYVLDQKEMLFYLKDHLCGLCTGSERDAVLFISSDAPTIVGITPTNVKQAIFILKQQLPFIFQGFNVFF
jgi:hypothetical protein